MAARRLCRGGIARRVGLHGRPHLGACEGERVGIVSMGLVSRAQARRDFSAKSNWAVSVSLPSAGRLRAGPA